MFICMCLFVAQAGLKAGLSVSDVEELLSLAKSQPIKDKLKQSTQEAMKYKASVKSVFYRFKFQWVFKV